MGIIRVLGLLVDADDLIVYLNRFFFLFEKKYNLELQSLGVQILPCTYYSKECLNYFEKITSPIALELKQL